MTALQLVALGAISILVAAGLAWAGVAALVRGARARGEIEAREADARARDEARGRADAIRALPPPTIDEQDRWDRGH